MRYYIEEALALAYGIVVSPKETLAVIVPEQRLREGIVIWSLSVMLSVVSVWVQWQDTAVWTAIAMYGGAAFCFAARILLYHGAARLLGRNGSMKSLAAALGHQVTMVSSSNYGEPLGYVAGITGFKKTNAKDTGEKIGSEMLIFCGLDSEAMDALLAALRERKLRIPLKAVVTPYNIQWSSRMLYEELKKEHESMTAMKNSPQYCGRAVCFVRR